MIEKIISGGQTGADRAALDVAIKLGIPHGGWIPKGRKTEDGTLPQKYKIQEMPTESYPARTEKNVQESDGTAIFTHGLLTGGSKLTQKLANQHEKHCLHIDLNQTPDYHAVFLVREWMYENEVEVLNVAGSRVSKDPLIYKRVFDIIEGVYWTDKVKWQNEGFGKMVHSKEPSSSSDCNNSRFDKILKVAPLVATLVGGAWVLVNFFAFRLEQEQLSLRLGQLQTNVSELELTGKSAFKIQTSPRLDISILNAGNSSTLPSAYLIVWEVGVINRGLRMLRIRKHSAEIYLGTQKKKLINPLESEIVNFPADATSNDDTFIKWEKPIQREFKEDDLYEVPVGWIGPGDKRSGELAAVVRAEPGTWIFTRTVITVEEEPGEQGEPGEQDMHVEWAYEILPDPKKSSLSKQMQPKQ